VKDALEKNEADTSEDAALKVDSLILAENMSLAEFEKMEPLLEGFRFRVEWENGTVLISKVALASHGNGTGVFIVNSGRDCPNVGAGPGRTIANANPAWKKIPDACITPHDRNFFAGGRRRYVTGVFEMLVSEELGQPNKGHDKVINGYLAANTGIQWAFLICVWQTWLTHAQGRFAAVALLYRRGAAVVPEQVISFGTRPIHGNAMPRFNGNNPLPGWTHPPIVDNSAQCWQAGLPNFAINVPKADIYHGVPANLLPAFANAAPPNYSYDLFEFREAIERGVRIWEL